MQLPLHPHHDSSTRRYAAGMDLGGTNLKYGIVSDRGEVVYVNLRPVDTARGGLAVLGIMKECAYECVMFARKEKFTLEGIGAGCPGTIDAVTGISLGATPHIPAWENVPIAGGLSEATGLRAVADNDGNFMAYGESVWGASKGTRLSVGLTIGTGIGGGIILDGRIHHGAIFSAAELGHVVVEANGRQCACGNRGCVERYAGGKYLTEDLIEAIRMGRASSITAKVSSLDQLTPRMIIGEAIQGDELCLELVSRMVDYLSAGLTSIVNVLNPEILVIGGGVAEAGEWLIGRVRRAVSARVMKPVQSQLRIEPAVLGNRAGFIGAATWILANRG